MPKKYNTSSMINDIVSIIRMRVADRETDICFAVKVDSNIPHSLYGDDTKIRQAALNILGNAIKYTDEGYILLCVRGEFLDDEVMNLIFEVTDTGVGIKEEDLSDLFQDFTQFDLERNRGVEGVGLGLAITNSIVSVMGGEIGVTSQYGKGSTFTITIPQRYKSKIAIATVKKPKEKKVLVYDRFEIHTETIVWSLSNLDVACTQVNSGTDLYAKMQGGAYDYLLITYEIFKRNIGTIREFERNTKVVVITKYGEIVSEKNVSVIAMPVFCTAIADILNGLEVAFAYSDSSEYVAGFIAPDARVLIVDDIKTNLKVTEGLLIPYGMKIDLRQNGAEAVTAVKKAAQGDASQRYDLILMDHKMPVMDGLEATRLIRNIGMEIPYCNEVPIIALTAHAVQGMREMYLSSGFDDYIPKPIDISKLNAALEKWIPTNKRRRIERRRH